ncbi:MAG: HDOD domain-containing protein [Desulfatitalea sp.]|nr:HDOD domain-containing protein [Desulfatitalea sp.]
MLLGESPTSSAPRKKKTEMPIERMLKRIRHTDEFPSISKYIIEINKKLSAKTTDCDASELANVILNDYGLTSKLLKLANSVNYAFASGNVTTVTRAVVVLGFEYVRMATISLSLFEHFKNKAFADDLKEEVVLSFWSGLLARDMAALEKDVDPEEAFVCAMLSRFGKLVMIQHLPGEYRKILNWMARHNCSETIAVKSVCGITYQELGRAVARQWNFPDRICDGLQSVTSAKLQNRGDRALNLAALTGFVKELGLLIQRQGLEDNDKAIQELLDRFKSVISISKSQLNKLIKASVGKVQQHAHAMDFSVANSLFFKHLTGVEPPAGDRAATAVVEPADIPASGSFTLADSADRTADGQGLTATNPIDLIMDGLHEISQAMMADCDFNEIVSMSLEILYRALAFQRALIFIRDGSSQWMKVRIGYGQQGRNVFRDVGFEVAADAKDLFNLSIRVGKDLIMADAADGKISHLIPSWYRRHIDAPAFIFLPIIVQKVTIGAIYADRQTIGQPISETEHRYLCMLRNQLVLAIQYRQGSDSGKQPNR